MELTGWVDRVERAVADPVELASLQEQIAADETLDADDRELMDGRIAAYLADLDEGAWAGLGLDGSA